MRRSLVEVFFVDSLCQLVEVLAPRPDVDARHGDLFDFLKWDIVVSVSYTHLDVYKRQYLCITEEVKAALEAKRPVVALESTILSHGMPYQENLEFSHKVEEIIRAEGAIPATTAIIGGKLRVGLTAEELEIMCRAENVAKVSRRDVAICLATGQTGATTVATTMMLAEMAGIRFFATGGIGGVDVYKRQV